MIVSTYLLIILMAIPPLDTLFVVQQTPLILPQSIPWKWSVSYHQGLNFLYQTLVFIFIKVLKQAVVYLKRLASRSHSNKHKISPSLTGPLTLRTIERPVPVPASASMNSTRTWVTLPVLPVRPRTLLTLASLTGWSCGDNSLDRDRDDES